MKMDEHGPFMDDVPISSHIYLLNTILFHVKRTFSHYQKVG